MDSRNNVSMSGKYIYSDVNEFVRHLIVFVNNYIDSSWIPQTSYRQIPKGVFIDTTKISTFGDISHNYNNISDLIDICLILKKSKYLYLNSDRTEGIAIHTLESKIDYI